MHYILTRGRFDRQITWDQLPLDIQAETTIVNQYGERVNRTARQIESPPGCKGIADKTQWLIDEIIREDKFIIMDDDLTFAIRRHDDPNKFEAAMPSSVGTIFRSIRDSLSEYAHVGVSGREGANVIHDPFLQNVRATRIMGYRRDVLRKENIRVDRLTVMQDFDTTLQLLRKGYPNLVINWAVHNQTGSNTAGGCSLFRTDEVQAAAAHELARLHPGFVTVVQKQTKKAWGGKERTDVRVKWKQAFNSAGTIRLLGE